MAEQTIPVADLTDFHSKDAASRAQFSQVVGDALNDLGFFAVVNHGVDQELIGRAYAQAAAFFDQPDSVKSNYEDEALKGQRGYTSFGREHAKGSSAPDLKEYWHVGRELPAGHPSLSAYGRNLWPTELPEFRPVMVELYQQLERCAEALLTACAEYLGETPDRFREIARDGDTILRVIHYPPVPPERDPASVRAAAHEDINLLTLLCEATDGGLELLQRDGTWRPIHALSGQIVVDAGDMLQNITNGVMKSTTHRVVNPSNDRSRRFSMPFFVHPRGEADLTPLEGCVERSGGEVSYPSWTAGEFLTQRLREIGLAG
ncbi:MAG: 2-oxoglutarate and iron-dependent oxygenase domain-containing protein [Myxococcota bacterium]